ncbi:MAG: type VI secretion system tube protein Hcp [Gammaproteobacteria bacterium]|nr:type VI secretion system tube protein Hcp [Gammaproteobacteria bacterium]
MSVFIFVPGVKGETSDKGHSGWIDVIQWNWGTSRKITSATSTRGDRESTNTITTDLEFSKTMDSATPQLFLEACCGTGKDFILRLTKTGTGAGADVFGEFVLKHALINKYKLGGYTTDRRRPIEHFGVSFTAIEMRYTPYDEDGKILSPIAVGFNTATNTKS